MSTVAVSESETQDTADFRNCREKLSASRPTTEPTPRHPISYATEDCSRFNGDDLPSPRDVQAVQWLDISSGGFSYITEKAPTYQRLVVALGARPNVTCMTAEIVQVCEVDFNGHTMFRVGCHFIGRLSNQ